ncbi:MAG: PIG-L family deacetylase [Ignavibacteriales bacterium]|nr:MAG: PIG-L family deacetylase [Ignavibacteriales bacterium]
MKILVVVAHPDDEVLGMGGALLKHQSNGDNIFVHILTNGESSRLNEVSGSKEFGNAIERRKAAAQEVSKVLAVKDLLIDNYDDQMLDTYPLISITKSIESFSKKIRPDIVYTHSNYDVNEDHRITFTAVLNAFRPAQNNYPSKILSAEIPSSTEWGYQGFFPNYFVNISDFLEKKIYLLSFYKNETRESPHPRSVDNIIINSKKWGSVIHCNAAEAFILIREVC